MVRKTGRGKWIYCTLISAGMKFMNRNKFYYSMPAYNCSFRALIVGRNGNGKTHFYFGKSENKLQGKVPHL
jgi:hypothetical protein